MRRRTSDAGLEWVPNSLVSSPRVHHPRVSQELRQPRTYMRLPSSFGTMSVCPCTSLARFKPSILTMATWCVLMGTVDVTFVRNSQGYPGLDYEICEGSWFVVLSSHWSVPFVKSCPRSPQCCHVLGLSMPHISMSSIQIPHEVITLVLYKLRLSQAPTVTSSDCPCVFAL